MPQPFHSLATFAAVVAIALPAAADGPVRARH